MHKANYLVDQGIDAVAALFLDDFMIHATKLAIQDLYGILGNAMY